LNARTSVLAAANPIHGRYDKGKTLKQNVDISAPILSRFDLFFVVLDECDDLVDYNIAQHIVRLHQNKEAAVSADFTLRDLQVYIKFARMLKPRLSKEAAEYLAQNYVELREEDATGSARQAYRYLFHFLAISVLTHILLLLCGC
jgi:DNA replication licensing factor MCM6